MIKILPLLLSCLFLSGLLVAQTDSNAVPAAPSVRHQATDPGQQKIDTAAARPKRIARKIPLTIQRMDTTIVPTARAAGSSPDSLRPVQDTASLHRQKEDAIAQARVFKAWNALLATNPSFNFMGKPMVETMEIHHSDSKDIFFYLFLGILFYFALVRVFFEKYFGNLITLFFRVSIRQQQLREQVLQTPLPSLLLNGLFLITGGLYASYLLLYYHFVVDINLWLLYLNCMVALGLIYLVKFLVLKFCGWVFSISRATDTYIFVVFLVNKMLGIFLLPFLILITFSGPTAGEIYVTISLIMVFVFLIYRIGASFRPIRNEIKLTPFHFFLYLCAFEIAPLLLIYKVLLAYLEKGY
jgi:Domain of unknown function (DUF4271)